MQYTHLKQTEIRISKIGIGTNKVGGHNIFKNLDENEGKNFIKEALNLGVNFIDTADYYGLGRSEELIGEVLQNGEWKREELVISTKGGMEWNSKGEITFNNQPEYLRSALEASLKRLQTDYVDVYYLHFPDKITPFSESVGELVRLKEEGKIRAIAASNLNVEQLKEINKVTKIAAFQSTYNMFERDAEKDILPFCVENEISYLPYYPLSSGLLGGNYRVDDTPPKRFSQEEFRRKVEVADELKTLAEAKETTLPNLALAWLLAQKGVDAVIPGGRRPDHASGNVKAVDVLLTQEDLREIDTLLTQAVQH
jgi:aryl-alcohol dehydrogenase-like predicted oxidoreductase